MKKAALIILAVIFIIPIACKEDGKIGLETPIDKKYAKYRANIYKDKELKTYLATLEKAEDVKLLDEEKGTDKTGKTIEISKVKLADDSVGYIESKNLADTPIVFIADTKAFVRPTSGSAVYAVIPKGELGFIIAEKGKDWVQVYAGEINKKYITQQWVENGYSKDPQLVLEAKEYAAAIKGLEDKDDEKKAQAKASLENIARGNSVIADMAKEKLGIPKEEKTVREEPKKSSEADMRD